jgi:hypothetical protein
MNRYICKINHGKCEYNINGNCIYEYECVEKQEV